MKKYIVGLLLMLAAPLALAGNTATVSWGAVTAYADGTPLTGPVTYSVYQGLQGQTKTLLQSGLTNLSLTVTSGLPYSSTVCFSVTATAGGQESAQSTDACKTFPAPPPPATPTGVTVK